MLKLTLQYFGHLMWRTGSLEKTLMLGKTEGRRRRGQQRMRWLDGITDSMDMSFSKLREFDDGQGSLACCSPWGRKESDTTELLNWTELCTFFWQSTGFSGDTAVKKLPANQCRRRRFNSSAGKIPWRRAWQFTPVFLPGGSHGQRSLMSYRVTKSQTWLKRISRAQHICICKQVKE